MENLPLVSVIVPTFNHEKFICHALDSILMQKVNFAYEILIGDDGSTDLTPLIIKKYQEKYPNIIRLWIRSKRLGASRNAYELLLNAKGEYLATCEGDDYWIDSEKLTYQINFLQTHTEYVGCTHKFRIVDENENEKRYARLSWIKQKKRFSSKDFAGFYLPGQPSTFVRRNIILQHPDDYSIFYKADPLISDRTAMMRFLEFGDFYCINRYMSCYRQSSQYSLTKVLYKNNKNHAIRDYHLHQILKQDAYERGTINLYGFKQRDMQIFSDLWICAKRNKNSEANKIVKSMIQNGNASKAYYLYLIFYCIKKLFKNIKTIQT